MNEKSQSLLRLMFDESDTICVSDSQFSFHAVPILNVFSGKTTLFSPNPSVPIKIVDSNDLVFVSLNPIKGFRNDKNCYKYKNFLIEMDQHERSLQIDYIKRMGLPYSAMIWSGSKSVHVLISLEGNGLPDEKSYRKIYKWILNVATMSDQALGNPSRCIRICGVIRPETGLEQELIEFKGPVSYKELAEWLNKHPTSAPKERIKRKPSKEADISQIKPWAAKLLKNGFPAGMGSNHGWFSLGAEWAVMGFTEEQAIEMLEPYFEEEPDFREKEWLTAINSGFKHINEK